jgi:hypothetical protein
MVCSICKQTGHNTRTCKQKVSLVSAPKIEAETDVKVEHKKTRGKNSFKNGQTYQHSIARKLEKICINEKKITVNEVNGAKSGPDINLYIENGLIIGIEVKNKGAFEGGSVKMEYDKIEKRMVFKDRSSLHQRCLADRVLYNGLNLPWYEGKKSLCEYKQVANIFNPEIRISLSSDSMSEYYKSKGVHYIQIEGYGLYHTGNDILNLDVPIFMCNQYLRIRTSKHKKKISGYRIPSDVVGDINYDKKTITKSIYDLNGKIPSVMKWVEE